MNRNRIFGIFARYGGILCAGFIVFTLLHIVGNGLPYGVAQARFAVAFERDNLSVEGYAHEHDFQSVHNLRGEEQFIECQIGRTILGDSQKTTDSRGIIGDAFVQKHARPAAMTSVRSTGEQCAALRGLAVGNEPPAVELAKTRYLWGFKAIYAILLRGLSVFQIRETLKALTYFIYLVLAVMLMRVSGRLFWLLSPVIAFGFLFSGIQFYSTVGNALGYLWALVTAIIAAGYLLYLKREVPVGTNAGAGAWRGLVWFRATEGERAGKIDYKYIIFACGMGSVYVWFLDGHLHLLLPLVISITYFGSGYALNYSMRERFRFSLESIKLFGAGFVSMYFVHMLAKATVVGWKTVFVDYLWAGIVGKIVSKWERFISGIEHLLTNAQNTPARQWVLHTGEGHGGGEAVLEAHSSLGSGLNVLIRLFGGLFRNYREIGLWGIRGLEVVMITGTVLAFLTALTVLGVLRRRQGRWSGELALLLAFAAVGILPPFVHDNIFQAARFMFIPCAYSAVAVIWVWQNRAQVRVGVRGDGTDHDGGARE